MIFCRKAIFQSVSIIVISFIVALTVNALRPDGLNILHAQTSSVVLPAASGEIALKDALMLFASNRAIFIDARSQIEFEQGHIKGAISLPVEQFEGSYKMIKTKLEGTEAIITYCDGERCPLSEELADKLKGQGVKNVFVLKNGWAVWKNEHLPVESSEVSAFLNTPKSLCTDCGK